MSLYEANNDLKTQKQLAAEPFAQAEKLREKRKRYQEVMDILNPPKEQAIEADVVQEQSRRYLESNEPDNAREWSAFNRSLANQTSDIADGKRRIVIQTADNVYLVEAIGYMQYDSIQKIPIGENIDTILDIRRRFLNGSDERTEVSDKLAEGFGVYRERNDWDCAGDGQPQETGRVNVMDGRESESDTAGDFEENYGYSSYYELIEAIQSGAMVMDDNGDLIEIPQNQERTSPLTDRDVLELAANEIKVDDLTEGEQSALHFQKSPYRAPRATGTAHRTEQIVQAAAIWSECRPYRGGKDPEPSPAPSYT